MSAARDPIQVTRERARRHGLQIIKRGDVLTVHDSKLVLLVGNERDVEDYLEAHPLRLGPSPYQLPPAWESAINAWLTWVQLSGRSPQTIRLRGRHVRMIARRSGTTAPGDVSTELVEALCSQPWSAEYRKGMRISLVLFFDWCVRNGAAESNPAAGLPRVKGGTPRPRPASEDMWRSLLDNAPPRELLMIRLAGESGMRRGEVARCHRDDLIEEAGEWSLIVHGKGDKQRVVPVNDSLADAIRAHVDRGHLFPGKIDGHISDDWVGMSISRMMPPGWSMHTLRHRFGTRACRGSRNLGAVQVLLGHSSVSTTERYCAVTGDEIRAAMMAALS